MRTVAMVLMCALLCAHMHNSLPRVD